MAGEGTKRIIELPEATTVSSGDYFAIDSESGGTKKTPASVFAKAADLTAEQTAREQAVADLKSEIGSPLIMINAYPDNSSVWVVDNRALAALIPIKEGDAIEVIGTSVGNDSKIGILKNVSIPIVAGDTADWSDDKKWNKQLSVAKNATLERIAPHDAQYLYFYYGFNGNHNRKPESLIVNGYDYTKDLTKNLIDSSSESSELYSYTFNKIADKKIYIVDGTADLTVTPPVWSGQSTNSSFVIPVKGGERMEVWASNDSSSAVSFLKSFENQSDAVLSYSSAEGFTSGITINQGLVKTFIIPDDVRFVVFYRGYTADQYNRQPYAVYIDGVNYLDALSNDVAEAKNTNNKFQTLIIPSIKSVNHGGFHTVAPWNSLPAFKLSKENGFSWVETDVQFTSDDVPVLCHDNYINYYGRMADGSEIPETVYIYESTYQELLEYDFGIKKGQEYAGLKITSLEELFRLGRGIGLGVRVELKANTLPTNEQIDIMFELAEKYGMCKNTEWISTSIPALQYITKKYPSANVVYIYTSVSGLSGIRTCIKNARTLRTGINQVIIYTSETISDDYAKMLVDNGFILDVQVSTLEDILAVTPYVTSFTSNYLVVEDALKDYYLSN